MGCERTQSSFGQSVSRPRERRQRRATAMGGWRMGGRATHPTTTIASINRSRSAHRQQRVNNTNEHDAARTTAGMRSAGFALWLGAGGGARGAARAGLADDQESRRDAPAPLCARRSRADRPNLRAKSRAKKAKKNRPRRRCAAHACIVRSPAARARGDAAPSPHAARPAGGGGEGERRGARREGGRRGRAEGEGARGRSARAGSGRPACSRAC